MWSYISCQQAFSYVEFADTIADPGMCGQTLMITLQIPCRTSALTHAE